MTTLEVVTGGVDTDMLRHAAAELEPHTDPSGWQWMKPAEWASRIVDAIERDKETLRPAGKSLLAKALSAAPAPFFDAVAARAFKRG